MATYTQADSHPPRIHPIASDLDTRHPPSLDSDLRYRPRSFYPEIQLRLAHRSHTLPALFSTCRESRDLIKSNIPYGRRNAEDMSTWRRRRKYCTFLGRVIVVFSMHCDKRLSEDGEFVNLVRKL
jgi:hypothetical protein